MNKSQRGTLRKLFTAYEQARDSFEAIRTEAATQVAEMADDEMNKWESLPEGLQDGDKGQEIYAASELLETLAEGLADELPLEEDWEEVLEL